MVNKTLIEHTEEKKSNEEFTCGIVMPIANHPEYSNNHWKEILEIITEVIDDISEYNFKCKLVSESEGIIDPIHKHIVNNLFDAELVICDISSKNPNVFFELGMRLAFDKPVIIIKDKKTGSPFDTSVIRYLEYDNELRYSNVIEFKSELKKSVIATLKEKHNNPNFSPFLKFFKEIKYDPSTVMSSESIEVPEYVQLLMNKLDAVERNQRVINNASITSKNKSTEDFVTNSILEEVILRELVDMYTNKEIDIDDINNDDSFYTSHVLGDLLHRVGEKNRENNINHDTVSSKSLGNALRKFRKVLNTNS